jgi:hypothetical protein
MYYIIYIVYCIVYCVVTTFTLISTDIITIIKNLSYDIKVISLRKLKRGDWCTSNWLVDTNILFTDFIYLSYLYHIVFISI